MSDITKYQAMTTSKLRMLLAAPAISDEKKAVIQTVVDAREGVTPTQPVATPPPAPVQPAAVTTPPTAPQPVGATTPPPAVVPPPAPEPVVVQEEKSIADIMNASKQVPQPVAPPAEPVVQATPPPTPVPVVQVPPAEPVVQATPPPAPVVQEQPVAPPPVAPQEEIIPEALVPVASEVVTPPVEKPKGKKAKRKRAVENDENKPWAFQLGQQVKLSAPGAQPEISGEIVGAKISRGFKEYIISSPVGKMTKRQSGLITLNS